MIKRLLCCALALLAALSLCSCKKETEPEHPDDFIEANWGDSRVAVSKLEEDDYAFATDELIMYTRDYDEQPAEIYYIFSDDSLMSGELKFVVGERTLNELMDSYLALREELTAVYGQPLEDDYRVWLDKDPATESDADNLQIYHQRMEYLSEWRTERSSMALTLGYNGGKIDYRLECVCLLELSSEEN